MSVELLSILVLCAIFLFATVLPICMGALTLAATFVFGMWRNNPLNWLVD